jgi:hypothetical protein
MYEGPRDSLDTDYSWFQTIADRSNSHAMMQWSKLLPGQPAGQGRHSSACLDKTPQPAKRNYKDERILQRKEATN